MKRTLLAVMAALAVTATSAEAQTIVSAVGGTINSGGPGDGLLSHTYNQAGLSANYVSGVTNFDTFLAGGGPKHTLLFDGYEWFATFGSNTASVTYDLGSTMTINKMALWNEESSGIGLLDLFGSVDGSSFFSLSTGLTPTDNPLDDYTADVFSFAATNLRYVRMDMSRCPQDDPGSYAACAIGEVAFRTADASVPEPASLALMIPGLAALGLAARRRRA